MVRCKKQIETRLSKDARYARRDWLGIFLVSFGLKPVYGMEGRYSSEKYIDEFHSMIKNLKLLHEKKDEQIYVAKSEEVLHRLSKSESDREYGELYGYPDCCIRKYIEEMANTEKLREMTPNSRYNEEILREGVCYAENLFLFHVPCNMNCEESRKLGRFYQKMVFDIYPKFHGEYIQASFFKVKSALYKNDIQRAKKLELECTIPELYQNACEACGEETLI